MKVIALMVHVELAMIEAVAVERERCAGICDAGVRDECSPTGLAATIRGAS